MSPSAAADDEPSSGRSNGAGTRRAAAAKDPYALLDVPRDASPERIRDAYERAIARAHRDGATKYAVEISAAFDTLSHPTRRALYDRHGMPAVRERSPGAAPPPTPWRIVKEQGLVPPRRSRRKWRAGPTAAAVLLGVVVGLTAGAALLREQGRDGADTTGPEPVLQQVACPETPAGPGYTYSAPSSVPPECANGAVPQLLGPVPP